MKKLLGLFALIVLTGNLLLAQASDADKLVIGVGGTFAKPKIIPSLQKLAIAQIKVNYKLTSTTRTVSKEKSTGAIAGAKLTAFLETTDGKLTEQDFQEITDYFYGYFQRSLKANGIDTVAWATIAATEFYQNASEKTVEASSETSGNAWATASAHKGNILYGGNIGFAMGKIKKASAFCEEVGAPAAFFNITVDFADVMVDVDIKTSGLGFYSIPKSRSWKYNSAVAAQVKVVPTNPGFSLFWNEKSQSESLYLNNDIESGVVYHDEMNQDLARMKNSMWAFSKEMNPVVIETTREKYKAAAKKALEKYADALIAKHKELK
ncbi:MAG TPA: hypothetical protein VHS96_00615 [Bacteroidia bacterium]|nr:hypothetical protein [Bacteroidia bacterium]